jgi:Ser/Thr protein kinase RdoA (MazF antagonist)
MDQFSEVGARSKGASLTGLPTAEAAKEINDILAGMERAIEDYYSGMPQDEKDVKWRINVLSNFIEDLVHDMRPERLERHTGISSRASGRIRWKSYVGVLTSRCAA